MVDSFGAAFSPLTEQELVGATTHRQNSNDQINDGAVCVMPIPDDGPVFPKLSTEANASWTYLDASGAIIGYVLRWNKPTVANPAKKDIRPLTLWRTLNGALEWRFRAWPGPRPLYGLDRLAERPQAPVLVVEGEKAADAATKLFPGYAVLTSPGGAKAAAKADWGVLSGRQVIVWPDQDKPGKEYAEDVARLVTQAGAKAVAIVRVPSDWPEGWDLADERPGNVSKADLVTLLNDATQSCD